MAEYRYTECGLDNVLIVGVSFISDDAGEECIDIPNVHDLHRAIAEGNHQETIQHDRQGVTLPAHGNGA